MSPPPDDVETWTPEGGPGLVASSPRADAPMGFVGSLLSVALGLAVCGLVAARLEPWRLPEGGDPLEAKLETLAARSGDIDTLFVGSSMVYRHVDPARFDEATAAAGRPTRSLNLGAPGMGGLELVSLVRRMLDQELPELRRVVIDWRGGGTFLADENALAPRTLAWHDATSTVAVLQMLGERAERQLGEDASRTDVWLTAAEFADEHLLAWGHRSVALGALGGHLEAALTGTAADRAERSAAHAAEAERVLGPAGDGFLDLEADLASAPPEQVAVLQERRAALVAGRPAYLAHLATARRRVAEGGPRPAAAELAVLSDLVETLRARSVAVYGIELPNLPPIRRLAGANAAGLDLPLLDLSDARAHPELFTFERRFDRNHLDARGAAALTDALAAEFLATAPEVER